MAPVIGCIGCGIMGKALLEGLAKADPARQLLYTDRSKEKMEAIKTIGGAAQASPLDVAQKADIIIIAVKPANISEVLDEIAPAMTETKMVVSIVAGYGLARLRNHLGHNPGICRIMPTTTAQTGKGVFAVCFDPLSANASGKKEVLEIFSGIGMCLELSENSFPAFSALIGAGPAYIFEMLAALAQAGVTLGFSATASRKMLLELLSGCVKLGADGSVPFMNLRDNVCSPGGLTIAAMNALDRAGFTGIVVDAVETAERKAREMER